MNYELPQEVLDVESSLGKEWHERRDIFSRLLTEKGFLYGDVPIPCSFYPLSLSIEYMKEVEKTLHVALKLGFSYILDPANRNELRKSRMSRFYIDDAKVFEHVPKKIIGSCRIDCAFDSPVKVLEFNMVNYGGVQESQYVTQLLLDAVPEYFGSFSPYQTYQKYQAHIFTADAKRTLLIHEIDPDGLPEAQAFMKDMKTRGKVIYQHGEPEALDNYHNKKLRFQNHRILLNGTTLDSLLLHGLDVEEKVFTDNGTQQMLREIVQAEVIRYDPLIQTLLDDKCLLSAFSTASVQQQYLTTQEQEIASLCFPDAKILTRSNSSLAGRGYALKKGVSCGGDDVALSREAVEKLLPNALERPSEWMLQKIVPPTSYDAFYPDGSMRVVNMIPAFYMGFVITREPFTLQTHLLGPFVRGGPGDVINIRQGGVEIPVVLDHSIW